MNISWLVFTLFLADISSAQTPDSMLLNKLNLVPLESSDCDAELCAGASINFSDDELYITFTEHRPRIRLHFIEPNYFTFGWSQAPRCSRPSCRDVVSIVGFATIQDSRVDLTISFTEQIIKEDSLNPFFRAGVGYFRGLIIR